MGYSQNAFKLRSVPGHASQDHFTRPTIPKSRNPKPKTRDPQPSALREGFEEFRAPRRARDQVTLAETGHFPGEVTFGETGRFPGSCPPSLCPPKALGEGMPVENGELARKRTFISHRMI